MGPLGHCREKRGESPNFCYELIYIINLRMLWNYEIELGIMKLAHYEVEWWSWIH